jgi:hypothetical protein
MNYCWQLFTSIFIVLISFVDGWLNYLYPPTIKTELNPLAAFIISVSSVQCMLTLKAIGTSLAFLFLQILYFYYKYASFIAVTIFALQLALLLYIIC